MKIVFYENSSGFAHYTYELCNAIGEKYGHDEIIYISDNSNKYMKKLNINIKGMPYLVTLAKLHEKNTLSWLFNRVSISIRNILKRNIFVRNEKPDVISIQSTIPILDQYFIKYLKKHTKIVLTVHDVIIPQKSRSWSESSLKNMYDIVDKLVVHSETNKKQLSDLFSIKAEKIVVIHHGVHTTYNKIDQEDCKRKIKVDNGKKTILFFGAIRESKGLDILIKALRGIECNLVIAGAMPFGETFEKYEYLLKDNMIDCRKYIEYITDEFAEILFQGCDLVALPYVYFYSQSGVFMEALQYRKPIVATDVSCFKEYVDRYDIGMTCKANDVGALHETINHMINCEYQLLKYQYNTERAVQENSWSKSADLHIELFNSIA